MSATYIDKQPSEDLPIAVSFVNRLPAGETIQNTSTVTATLDDGTDASSFLSGSPSISNPIITVKVTGGAQGRDYSLRFLAITQNYKFEYDVIVQVNEVR